MKRLQTLITFLFLLLPKISTAQLPQQKDSTELSLSLWRSYTRIMLFWLFPEDSSLVKAIGIDIVPSEKPDAQYFINRLHPDSSRIKISLGMIFLIESRDEYAYLVGHEFGHIKLNHPSTGIVSRFGSFEDFGLLEKQEIVADSFSILTMRRRGYNPCAAASALKKLIDFNHLLRNPENPFNKIHIKRYALSENYCPGESSYIELGGTQGGYYSICFRKIACMLGRWAS